jgi:TfoX/Sxy family transcriptional regulator of competence genes
MERHIVRAILSAMASIGKVEYRVKDEFIGFYKNNVLFAKLLQDELYFLSGDGSFVKFEQPLDNSSIQSNLATAYGAAG